jgi:hypothetical protein
VPHPLQLRVRVFCSERTVAERAIRLSLQKVKTRTLEHRKGAAPNFTKISVLNDRLHKPRITSDDEAYPTPFDFVEFQPADKTKPP